MYERNEGKKGEIKVFWKKAGRQKRRIKDIQMEESIIKKNINTVSDGWFFTNVLPQKF